MAVPSQTFTPVIITFSVLLCTPAMTRDGATGKRTGVPVVLSSVSGTALYRMCVPRDLSFRTSMWEYRVTSLAYCRFCFSTQLPPLLVRLFQRFPLGHLGLVVVVVGYPVSSSLDVCLFVFLRFHSCICLPSLCFLPLSQHVFVSSASARLPPAWKYISY